MNDPRLGDLIAREFVTEPLVVLIGFPSDEGVRRNGGRPGAAEAPAEIRKALRKFTPDAEHPEIFCHTLHRTLDAGDVEVTGDLERDQERLGDNVAKWLNAGAIPIVIGGGHETAFGHFLGYVASQRQVRIVNVDAHTDVRPLKSGKAHSGSPFFQAIEHPDQLCRGYTVLGLNPWSVAASHLKYLTEKGGAFKWSRDVTPAILEEKFEQEAGPTMVTLDMDAVIQTDAPGVSAPAVNGLDAATFLHAAYLAGRSAAVSSLDLSEVNPQYDVDGRTIRLAALTVWHFLKGVAERQPAIH